MAPDDLMPWPAVESGAILVQLLALTPEASREAQPVLMVTAKRFSTERSQEIAKMYALAPTPEEP